MSRKQKTKILIKSILCKQEVTASVCHIFLAVMSYISKIEKNEYRFKNKICSIRIALGLRSLSYSYLAPDKFLRVESQVKTLSPIPLPLSYSMSLDPPLPLQFSKATQNFSFSKIPRMLQTPGIRRASQRKWPDPKMLRGQWGLVIRVTNVCLSPQKSCLW